MNLDPGRARSRKSFYFGLMVLITITIAVRGPRYFNRIATTNSHSSGDLAIRSSDPMTPVTVVRAARGQRAPGAPDDVTPEDDDRAAAQEQIFRGTRFWLNGLYEEALEAFDVAIRREPMNAMALMLRASILATCRREEFRNGERAIEDATRACELKSWKDAATINTLAAAHAETGDFDNAIHWQQRAIELAGTKQAEAFQTRLQLYQSHTPYRTPMKN